jgi:hypothetical protein
VTDLSQRLHRRRPSIPPDCLSVSELCQRILNSARGRP